MRISPDVIEELFRKAEIPAVERLRAQMLAEPLQFNPDGFSNELRRHACSVVLHGLVSNTLPHLRPRDLHCRSALHQVVGQDVTPTS